MLILRVGNTPFIVDGVEIMLRQHDISSEHAVSGREALDFLRLYDFDLVLMDQDLPDLPAHKIVRTMRAALLNTPVLVLSHAATPIEARIKLLNEGADDVWVTPCESQEFLARIRALVRRRYGHTQSSLVLGPVELRLDRRDVRVHGVPLRLSRREYAAMELLFLKQGVVLNQNAFLTHLYVGSADPEPQVRTIDVIIYRLRKKLAEAGVATLIDTIWGCGYTLRDPSSAPTAVRQDVLNIDQIKVSLVESS